MARTISRPDYVPLRYVMPCVRKTQSIMDVAEDMKQNIKNHFFELFTALEERQHLLCRQVDDELFDQLNEVEEHDLHGGLQLKDPEKEDCFIPRFHFFGNLKGCKDVIQDYGCIKRFDKITGWNVTCEPNIESKSCGDTQISAPLLFKKDSEELSEKSDGSVDSFEVIEPLDNWLAMNKVIKNASQEAFMTKLENDLVMIRPIPQIPIPRIQIPLLRYTNVKGLGIGGRTSAEVNAQSSTSKTSSSGTRKTIEPVKVEAESTTRGHEAKPANTVLASFSVYLWKDDPKDWLQPKTTVVSSPCESMEKHMSAFSKQLNSFIM